MVSLIHSTQIATYIGSFYPVSYWGIFDNLEVIGRVDARVPLSYILATRKEPYSIL